MNGVLYLRYSSDKQNEQSIEGQQRICTQYCEQNNIDIVDVYVDRALSASKDIEKRTSFQQMIKDSEKQKFDVVVVYKLDRFARNRFDSATYKNKLKKNGVRVISATEHISDNPEGIILESVLEGMAEFYSQELAQKVSRGMHESALKCNSCGGSIPLGYKIIDKKYVIDEATAPIAKEAFERYAKGESIIDIYNDFNQRGLRTSKGVPFSKNSFRNMFRNEKYIGIYKYKDVRIENGVPAIIDKVTFELVQQRVKNSSQEPRSPRSKAIYLLANKLFCGHCGDQMNGEYGTGKNGNKYYYYNCLNKKFKRGCDKKALPKELIERWVVEDAKAQLTPKNIQKIADMAISAIEKENRSNTSIEFAKKQIGEIEISINNLVKIIEKGSTSAAILNRIEELEKQKQQANYNLRLAQAQNFTLEREHIVWWLSKFSQGDTNDEDYRRRVIDMLVNSVTVWDDPDGYRITITYHLTSIKASTFKCSNNLNDGSPSKKTFEHRSNVFFTFSLFTLHSSLLTKGSA